MWTILLALVTVAGAVKQSIHDATEQDYMQYQMSSARLSYLPPAHPDIFTTSRFVDVLNDRVPIGEEVTLLCGFVNDAVGAVNVTGIMGSLNAPQDFSQYMMNFTWKNIQEEVDADQEVTFSYPFRMDPSLEAMTLQMAMTVFYSDEAEEFSTTFFNQTVEFVHLGSTVDYNFVVQIAVGCVVGTGILTLLYMDMTKKKSA